MTSSQAPAWLRPAVDYGPLIAFFVTYLLFGLMPATAVIIAASVVAAILAWGLSRRLPAMPLITAAVVAVFGGLTLWLRDDTFIKMKPTIVQGLIAIVLLGGLALRRPLLKPLLGPVLPPMPDGAWRSLTLRYALFFIAMAVLNEVVWRTQSTDVWVSFKVFGIMLLTILFALLQMPFLNRHRVEEEAGGSTGG